MGLLREVVGLLRVGGITDGGDGFIRKVGLLRGDEITERDGGFIERDGGFTERGGGFSERDGGFTERGDGITERGGRFTESWWDY